MEVKTTAPRANQSARGPDTQNNKTFVRFASKSKVISQPGRSENVESVLIDPRWFVSQIFSGP